MTLINALIRLFLFKLSSKHRIVINSEIILGCIDMKDLYANFIIQNFFSKVCSF